MYIPNFISEMLSTFFGTIPNISNVKNGNLSNSGILDNLDPLNVTRILPEIGNIYGNLIAQHDTNRISEFKLYKIIEKICNEDFFLITEGIDKFTVFSQNCTPAWFSFMSSNISDMLVSAKCNSILSWLNVNLTISPIEDFMELVAKEIIELFCIPVSDLNDTSVNENKAIENAPTLLHLASSSSHNIFQLFKTNETICSKSILATRVEYVVTFFPDDCTPPTNYTYLDNNVFADKLPPIICKSTLTILSWMPNLVETIHKELTSYLCGGGKNNITTNILILDTEKIESLGLQQQDGNFSLLNIMPTFIGLVIAGIGIIKLWSKYSDSVDASIRVDDEKVEEGSELIGVVEEN